MTRKADLLRRRFRLNMERLNAIIIPNLNAPSIRIEGAKADILRLAVVFLHATFEVALRSHLPTPDDTLTFSGASDIDKALKRSGIDPMPFKHLYAPLVQMARRRIRIVHDADLPSREAVSSGPWEFSDSWLMTLWLLAVPAFHHLMQIVTGTANVAEQAMYDRLMAAIQKHRDFGKQVLALPGLTPERFKEALGQIGITLDEITALLNLQVSDLSEKG